MEIDINKRALFIVTIIILGICIFGFVQYGRISAQREYEKQLEIKQNLIELNKNILVPVVLPTETEAPFLLYSPSPMLIDNRLKMGEFFNWKTNNASGRANLNVSITIWKYKLLDGFEYYDYHWGQIFNQQPNYSMIYFLAYVHIEMDMTVTGSDVRMYLPQQDNFALQINDMIYYPVIFDYEHNQIKQLENEWNYARDIQIAPYAYEYVNSIDDNTGINHLIMMKKEWLKGGISNAEDGYIVFEVPNNFNPRMVKILASFYSFGSASWKITD